MNKTILLTLICCFIALGSYSQGCMEASSEEGVQITGYLQPQFDYNIGDNSNQSSFKFNRARIGAIGSIPYDFSYYFFAELSPFKDENPYLLDAFITYSRFAPYAKVSVGQFKSPFSLELNTPCHGLYTINRSKVVSELAGPFRDLGVLISGGNDTTLINYSVGIMNGTGKGVFDKNINKDLVGRLVIKPFDFLKFGGSVKYGKTTPLTDDLPEGTLNRFGGELEVNYGNFLLQAEYIMGQDKGSYTTGGGCGEPLEIHEGTVKRQGFYAQAMYMTPWMLQPVVKVEMYDSDMDIASNSEYITTFGVNYFFNDWTRLQINYLYKAEEKKEIANDQILIQLQVKF